MGQLLSISQFLNVTVTWSTQGKQPNMHLCQSLVPLPERLDLTFLKVWLVLDYWLENQEAGLHQGCSNSSGPVEETGNSVPFFPQFPAVQPSEEPCMLPHARHPPTRCQAECCPHINPESRGCSFWKGAQVGSGLRQVI